MASRTTTHLGLAPEEPTQPGGGSTGDGGDLVGYRLGELERRVGSLERSTSEVKETVARIEESMKGVATKYVVSFWIIGAVLANFVAVACHLLIRSLGSG